jgi:SAM-dependent methyltransferase
LHAATALPTPEDCPACANSWASDGTTVKHFTSDLHEFDLVACRRCDTQVWLPLIRTPSQYETEAMPNYERRHAGEVFLRPRHLRCLEQLRSLPPSRVFDVGCGEGAFLAKIAALGHSVSGCDVDHMSVQVAREMRGVDAHVANLEDVLAAGLVQPGSFDVVTMCEVLEHVTSAAEGLPAVRRLLRPGGLLLGTVPNRERFAADVSRRSDIGDFPPHHYLWFSSSALERALTSAGFAQVRIAAFHHQAWQSSPAYTTSLVRSLARSRRPAPPAANLAASAALSAPRSRTRSHVLRRARDASMLPVALVLRRLGRPTGLFFRAVSA